MREFSILRKLRLSMLSFGLAMGVVFPIYAHFFVEWKPGMLWFFISGCLLAGLTVGLVSYYFVKVILLKKLKEVSEVANSIENKNLNRNLDIRSNDDIGLIVNGINKSISNIQELFIEINSLFKISEQAICTVRSDGGSNSAIQQISYAIEDVTSNTKEIEHYFNNVKNSVSEGKTMADTTLVRQQKAIGEMKFFSESIQKLVASTLEITGAMQIIKDIAKQTNILSLNASVEASRAGEHGKGFAIVASEIRKLASSSNDSSQKIITLIDKIQSDVNSAGMHIDAVNKGLEGNNRAVGEMADMLNDVFNVIEQSRTYNDGLNVSVKNLNVLFGDVNIVFEELNDNLGKLREMVEQYNF